MFFFGDIKLLVDVRQTGVACFLHNQQRLGICLGADDRRLRCRVLSDFRSFIVDFVLETFSFFAYHLKKTKTYEKSLLLIG